MLTETLNSEYQVLPNPSEKKTFLRRGRLGGSVGQVTAFGSGHDPGVPGSSPTSGSLLSRESASLSDPPPSHALSLYLILSLK